MKLLKKIIGLLKQLRQIKPFRVWVWKAISATLALVWWYLSVSQLNMPADLLWLLPVATATIDSLVKIVNVKLLWDIWVDNVE